MTIPNQEPVPTATNDEAEFGSKGEQGEAVSEGEALKEEQGEELNDNDSSDEEVRMPIKKKPLVTPRKSIRLSSKEKRPVVSLDNDSSTHTSHEPKHTTPPSPKPDTPPSHHIPSPQPSPIPSTPPPTTTPASPPPHSSPGLGFPGYVNPSVTVALLDPILNKLEVLQSQFYSFQDEVRVIFASLTDQLTQMETCLSAKLDTVDVQTEYVEEEEHVA